MATIKMGHHTQAPVVKTNKAERDALHWVGRGACSYTYKMAYGKVLGALREKGLLHWEDGHEFTTDAGTDVLIDAGLVTPQTRMF